MLATTKIGRIRQGRGINAQAFAAMLRQQGIATATPHRVYRIEAGLTKTTQREREVIAAILNIPTYEVPR